MFEEKTLPKKVAVATLHSRNNVCLQGVAMRISVIHILIFTLCLSWGVSAHAQDAVTLTNGDWPPYVSQDFKSGGVGSLICTTAFKLEGVNVEYTFLPWKRGYEMTKAGHYNGAVGWRKTPGGEKHFYYSDPIFMERLVFFHRMGSSFDWKTLDDIGHLRIGATLGYQYIELLQGAVDKMGGSIDIAPSDELNLQKLAEGRIDLFPCAEKVGYYLLRTRFIPGLADLIRHHSKPIATGELHLLISKKTTNGKELIETFNRGLKKMHDSGQYDQFMTNSLKGVYLPE